MAALHKGKRRAITITDMFAAHTFLLNTLATPQVDESARAAITKKTTG